MFKTIPPVFFFFFLKRHKYQVETIDATATTTFSKCCCMYNFLLHIDVHKVIVYKGTFRIFYNKKSSFFPFQYFNAQTHSLNIVCRIFVQENFISIPQESIYGAFYQNTKKETTARVRSKFQKSKGITKCHKQLYCSHFHMAQKALTFVG